MAYDKIITIRRRMDNCLGYVLNEEKNSLNHALSYAENPRKAHQPVTGINCQANTAFAEMQATKLRWDKRGGILGYHLIHSYAPGEVTPEQAHAAGVEFARRLLGDRYEAVVSTHIDRKHLHCHIVFNSVSFVDGKKYRSDFKSYFGDVRGTSNEVSRDYGLSVIEPSGKRKHYAEWNAERTGRTTVRGLIRQDIDAALQESFTFASFLAALRRQGYTVKYGPQIKHTALQPPGGTRFFRLDSLGAGYTEPDIRAKLSAVRSGEPIEPTVTVPVPRHRKCYIVRGGLPPCRSPKPRGFRALYVYYLYLLGARRPRGRSQYPFPVRAEVAKLHRYQRQFRFLQYYRIENTEQLSMLEGAFQAQIDALTEQRKTLYRQKRDGQETEDQIQTINQTLRELKGKLRVCARITEDVPHIRVQIEACRSIAQQEKEEHHQTKSYAATDKSRPERHFGAGR